MLTQRQERVLPGATPLSKLLLDFKGCCRFYAAFHVLFLSFLSLQALAFLLFFSYFTKSAAAAFALALFFFTLFSYLVLFSFFQTKKAQEIRVIRDSYSEESESFHSSRESAFCAPIKEALQLLANQELSLYKTSPVMAKLRAKLYSKTFYLMRESLLLLSLEKQTAFIQSFPTNTQVHISLAETYVDFCKLYLFSSNNPHLYQPIEKKQKIQFYAERALTECKIAEEYGGKSLWSYSMLAEIYGLLGDTKQEIEQYEELVAASPDDFNILFQLGVLYFKEGECGKGLKVYEELQKQLPEKANELIQHYKAASFQEASSSD
jgi:tetratricopeptide (TPR) repeat protein